MRPAWRDSDTDAGLAMLSDQENISIGGTIRPALIDDRFDTGLDQQGGAALQNKRIITAFLRTSAFPDVKLGDTVTVHDTDYTIYDIQTGGERARGDRGMTEFWLKAI